MTEKTEATSKGATGDEDDAAGDGAPHEPKSVESKSVESKSKTTAKAKKPALTAAERRSKWITLLISTLVSLFLAECGLRVLKRNRAFQPDPDLIRSLQANNPGHIPTLETDDNLNGRSEAIPPKPGTVINPTNNIGFRMTEDVGPKRPDEKRVLVLGDSYTEAFQVNAQEAFWALTDKALRADPKTSSWRVLNGGVENGCPSQYVLQLRKWLPEIKPDIVVIALAPNDLADDYAYERWYGFDFDSEGLPIKTKSETELWLLQKSYILRYTEFATLTGSPKLHNFLFPDASPSTEMTMWQELACQNSEHSKQLFDQRTAKYLLGIKKMVEAAGAKLGIAMVQYLYFFENETYYKPFSPTLPALLEKYGCYKTKGLPYQSFIEGFLTKNGFAFKNPYEAMAESEQREPKKKLWHYVDYHYSPAGHVLMANAMTELVREIIGVTPAAGSPGTPAPPTSAP